MAVYMIRAGVDGPVKIGFAVDPTRRVDGLQTGQPEKLTIIRVMEGCRKFEAALHRHFAHLRTRGEWFTHSDEMLGDLEFLRANVVSNDPTPLATYMASHELTDASLGIKVGVGAEAVRLWRRGIRPISAERALTVSKVTGITCHALRPDIWLTVNDGPPPPARLAEAP
jgi:hypothetical protein